MPTITFSFDTGKVPAERVIDAVAVVYGYQESVADPNNPGKMIANPQTKEEFAGTIIKRILTDTVQDADRRAMRATAEATVTPIELTSDTKVAVV